MASAVGARGILFLLTLFSQYHGTALRLILAIIIMLKAKLIAHLF